MAKKVIELNHVSKIYKLFGNDKKRFLATFNKSIKYKEKIAINDITFSVDKGESVAIFGRNGAGKSTICLLYTSDLRIFSWNRCVAGQCAGADRQRNCYYEGCYLHARRYHELPASKRCAEQGRVHHHGKSP